MPSSKRFSSPPFKLVEKDVAEKLEARRLEEKLAVLRAEKAPAFLIYFKDANGQAHGQAHQEKAAEVSCEQYSADARQSSPRQGDEGDRLRVVCLSSSFAVSTLTRTHATGLGRDSGEGEETARTASSDRYPSPDSLQKTPTSCKEKEEQQHAHQDQGEEELDILPSASSAPYCRFSSTMMTTMPVAAARPPQPTPPLGNNAPAVGGVAAPTTSKRASLSPQLPSAPLPAASSPSPSSSLLSLGRDSLDCWTQKKSGDGDDDDDDDSTAASSSTANSRHVADAEEGVEETLSCRGGEEEYQGNHSGGASTLLATAEEVPPPTASASSFPSLSAAAPYSSSPSLSPSASFSPFLLPAEQLHQLQQLLDSLESLNHQRQHQPAPQQQQQPMAAPTKEGAAETTTPSRTQQLESSVKADAAVIATTPRLLAPPAAATTTPSSSSEEAAVQTSPMTTTMTAAAPVPVPVPMPIPVVRPVIAPLPPFRARSLPTTAMLGAPLPSLHSSSSLSLSSGGSKLNLASRFLLTGGRDAKEKGEQSSDHDGLVNNEGNKENWRRSVAAAARAPASAAAPDEVDLFAPASVKSGEARGNRNGGDSVGGSDLLVQAALEKAYRGVLGLVDLINDGKK